jgi:hypothetical protein
VEVVVVVEKVRLEVGLVGLVGVVQGATPEPMEQIISEEVAVVQLIIVAEEGVMVVMV